MDFQIKRYIFFIIFCLCTLLHSNQVLSELLNEEFVKTYNLIKSGNFKDAKLILESLREKNPNNMEIINNIAVIEAESGNIEEAINLLTQSLTFNPNLETIYKNLTKLYAYQANVLYEEALSIDEKKQYNISLKPIGKIQHIEKVKEKNIEISSKKNIDTEIKINTNDQEESVSNLVTSWSKSWEEKKLDKYFKCYLDNYKAKNYSKHSEWKKDREQRIKNKKNIKIEITDLNIIILNEKNSLIEFQQNYKSDSFNDKVTKHLILIKHKDGWKIAGEYIVR
ncbi:MAG: tetratricopeptide repeat protein [Pseudomonadota bacterium]|nr:tetratricopeptide repeat protein [Pseudomonadota bacterium]